MKDFGVENVCHEVGLLVYSLNVCRMEKMFSEFCCMRNGSHKVYNDHHVLSNE